MAKNQNELEQIKTDLVGLKIKIKRLEEYLLSFPSPDDYITAEEEAELLEKAVKIAKEYSKVSASLLQRRLSIGYANAARIIDKLEEERIVAPPTDGAARDVLIN